jgi:hypothetical protein
MTFKKGNKRGKGRPVGGVSKLPAEAKDLLARAYTELGGFEGFVKWCKSSDERLDWFYTRMWIKLLPMNIQVQSNKNIVYKSYHEGQCRPRESRPKARPLLSLWPFLNVT